MKNFYIKKKISAIKDLPAITFAHGNSFDDAKNHSLHLNSGHIELYVYISGAVDFIISDNYISLKNGDVLIINPNQVHKAVIKNPTKYERFYILLPLHSLDCFNENPIKDFLNNPNSSAKITLSDENKEAALNILYKISNMLSSSNTKYSEFEVIALIMQFLHILNTGMEENPNNIIPANVYIPLIIKDVLQYIGESLETIKSVSTIAEHFHISLPYLSAIFKKHVGVTLSCYLKTKRIANAKTLLEKGYSVSYACYESGFSDTSYFIKVFKEQVGITPHQYKNNSI